MANEVGDTEQVAPEGTVHVKFDVWLKPLSGAALTWKLAVPPVEASEIDCRELVSVKSGAPEAPADVPAPVSATDCVQVTEVTEPVLVNGVAPRSGRHKPTRGVLGRISKVDALSRTPAIEVFVVY